MKRTSMLVFAGVVGVLGATATMSNAVPGGKPKPDAQAAVEDVRGGRGRVLRAQAGQDVEYSGWWHGCRFHITKSSVTFHEAPNGRRVRIVGAPEPVPPRQPGCVDREPTEAEINALQAEVTALNARGRPPGAPEPPPLPPSRSGQPSVRP